ncbi:MAG: hypothetical protein HN580_25560 [Deltaproteobacteria bacterium]|jgi:DNA-nicking Smr family endonuclease|nr:hypothetical protein [Deltaproteobacteria bacterium]MBT6500322.1 hypothetical protein [Deltaproteobacteria bacterium]MBT6612996.1 hypothetical protein [Deltaproteobacteria bacterium]MBT7892406.1 hypothetical protein [Deltaproteobacteria bacterium]
MKTGKKKKKLVLQKEVSNTPDEAEVFRNLMKNSGITKLKYQPDPHRGTSTTNSRNEPIEFKGASDWQPELDNLSPSEKFSGLQKTARRKTRSKQKIKREFTPNDTLDLHGKTRDQAISRVHRLIRQALSENYQSILIITGKGVNSKERGGVLGKVVWEWLQSYQEDQPIRFQWAPSFLGGKGAILVFF